MFVCILPEKAVPEMTYSVLGGTLNPTHSLTHYLVLNLKFCFTWHKNSFSISKEGSCALSSSLRLCSLESFFGSAAAVYSHSRPSCNFLLFKMCEIIAVYCIYKQTLHTHNLRLVCYDHVYLQCQIKQLSRMFLCSVYCHCEQHGCRETVANSLVHVELQKWKLEY